MFTLDIQTVFVMVILISASFALALGWMAADNRDGLRSFAAALSAHAAGYLLLALRGGIPDWISMVVANAAIGASGSLVLHAISRFRERPYPAALLLGPPAVVAVGLSLAMDDIHTRIIIANSVFAVQNLVIARELVRHRFDSPVRGRNLVVAGSLVVAALLLTRVAVAVFDPAALNTVYQSSVVQRASYLLVFLAIVLISNGYLMMTKERSDARLLHAALRDRLTGCWNRTHIEAAAAQELARLRRYGHPAAAILMDIDHFKAINDRHGHDGGDTVLREFAEVARASLRNTDVLGRWGGEEFLAILPMTGLAEAIATAERLRRNVAQHAFAIGAPVTASVGVAACLSADGWDDWFRRTDAALYRAKNGGRNLIRADAVTIADAATGESPWIYQLVWRNAYLCGQPEIDSQHRDLFDGANRLLALGTAKAHAAEIDAAIGAFLDHIRRHFADEERILKAADFAGAATHAAAHAELMDRAETLLESYRSGGLDAAAIFHFVIHELFAQHILLDDHAFAEAFAHT